MAYLQINRLDLAEKSLAIMKKVEEDNCLVNLTEVWISMHNPKAPVQNYDSLI